MLMKYEFFLYQCIYSMFSIIKEASQQHLVDDLSRIILRYLAIMVWDDVIDYRGRPYKYWCSDQFIVDIKLISVRFYYDYDPASKSVRGLFTFGSNNSPSYSIYTSYKSLDAYCIYTISN